MINVMLETLVRQRSELPAFSTRERVAVTARAAVNRRSYQRIATGLDAPTRARLELLLTRSPEERRSPWDRLKQAPKSPTVKPMHASLAQRHWLQAPDISPAVFAAVLASKREQFAAEARSLAVYALHRLRWASGSLWRRSGPPPSGESPLRNSARCFCARCISCMRAAISVGDVSWQQQERPTP